MPLVLIARTFKELAAGDELEIVNDDRYFAKDVEAWCEQNGHQLVSVESRGSKTVARVRKC